MQQESEGGNFGFMVPSGFKELNSEAWIEMGVRLVARGAFESPEKFVNSVNFLEALLGERIEKFKRGDKTFWEIYDEELLKVKKRIENANEYEQRKAIEEAKLKFRLFIRVIRQMEPEDYEGIIKSTAGGVEDGDV